MQQDFHYDVTFIASLLAGFSFDQAQTIAWAAQHVDNANSRDTKIVECDGNRTQTFKYQQTAQHDPEIFFGTHHHDTFRQVWMAYHFMPGNFKGDVSEDRPQWYFRGRNHDQILTDRHLRHLSLRSRQRFPLICRPNSGLSIHLIDQLRCVYWVWKDLDHYKLALPHLIGITMHVFADTWAHQGHLASPDRAYNHIESKGEYLGGRWRSDHSFQYNSYTPTFPFKILGLRETTQTITTRAQEQTLWLGHGMVGKVPDWPWVVYPWHPRWSESVIVRNNPKEFLQAFVNLVQAMKCVRGNYAYQPVTHPGQYQGVVGSVALNGFKEAITKMRKTKMEKDSDRSAVWWTGLYLKLRGQLNLDRQTLPEYVTSTEDQHYKRCSHRPVGRKMRYRWEEFIQSKKFLYHFAAKVHFKHVVEFLRTKDLTMKLSGGYSAYRTEDDLAKILGQPSPNIRQRKPLPRPPRKPLPRPPRKPLPQPPRQ